MAFRSLQPQSGRGRQAEARRNDLVVLEAARDVFAAQGADAPIAAVAARAGVGAEAGIRSRLVAIALDGLRARPGLVPGGPGSLPGPAPDRRDYVNRWSPRS